MVGIQSKVKGAIRELAIEFATTTDYVALAEFFEKDNQPYAMQVIRALETSVSTKKGLADKLKLQPDLVSENLDYLLNKHLIIERKPQLKDCYGLNHLIPDEVYIEYDKFSRSLELSYYLVWTANLIEFSRRIKT